MIVRRIIIVPTTSPGDNYPGNNSSSDKSLRNIFPDDNSSADNSHSSDNSPGDKSRRLHLVPRTYTYQQNPNHLARHFLGDGLVEKLMFYTRCELWRAV